MTIKPKSGGKYYVELIALIRVMWFGGKCMWNKDGESCAVKHGLEFAHVIPTELSTKKKSCRSSQERYFDLLNHPECFLLFCPHHHMLWDGRTSIMVWKSDYYSGDYEID